MLGARDFTSSHGDLILDTKDGTITLTDPVSGSSSVVLSATDAAKGFTKLPQSNGPLAAVWSFASLNIPSTINVIVAINDDSVPVLAATGKITVDGTISVLGLGGPGGTTNGNGQTRQGLSNMAAGLGGTNGGGGGGGGYETAGKPGMAGGAGAAAGGMAQSIGGELVPLVPGGGGGGGGSLSGMTTGGGLGGNGGGAIALFAQLLDISGQISARGADGGPPTVSGAGGGGGGSGGGILLAADTINFRTGNTLDANGGKGLNGGGDGGNGWINIFATMTPTGFTATPMDAATPIVAAKQITKFPQ
jgi:hypothetical protein